MQTQRSLRWAVAGFATFAFGCGSTTESGFPPDNSGMDGGIALDEAGNPVVAGMDGGKGACVGIKCNQVTCPGGGTTSVSGTAYAPNGKLPLYNVIAYIPNGKPDALIEGVTCDKCGSIASGNPIVTALSDSSGKFKLTNVPVGDNIPLVLQVGKWRRQVVIPHVAKCVDTPLTDPQLTRLPAKRSEGDMPHIAVTTGGYDSMACLLPKMGIDPSEFGVEADLATKRVIFFQGEPGQSPRWGAMTSAETFWNDPVKLKKFDVTILSCEGSEHLENKQDPARASMDAYLKAGGRALGTDFMYTWFRLGPPPLPTTAVSWYGGAPFDNSQTYDVDTTFPKGKALGEWLTVVGASPSPGKLPLPVAFSNLSKANMSISQRWVSGGSDQNGQPTDKVFTFNTPIGAAPDAQCGKAVFLDAHVGITSAQGDIVDSTYPAGCNDSSGKPAELNPAEKAFVFFLMDLSSCIQPDNGMVTPPPVK